MKKIGLRFVIMVIALLLAAAPVRARPAVAIRPAGWQFEINQAADISVYNHRELMVSSGCDVNGDGFDDLLVGKRDYDVLYPRDDNGRVWLFMGGPSGLGSAPALTLAPPYTNYYGFFGTQVVCLGSVNGDLYQDVAIGMDNYDNTYQDEGAVFVYYGSAGGLSPTYSWMTRGNTTYGHWGLSLDAAGDVNGDGFDDLIVGNYENYLFSSAHAYVWYGGAAGLGESGLPSNADWIASGPPGQQTNYFGRMVRGIGDVNGDGFDDILVGAYLYDGAVSDQGAVYAWYGSAAGLGDPGTPANADWSAVGDQSSAYFGLTGDGVGDLNGDGFDDLAVGAYGYDAPEVNEGKVFVWYGSAAGLGYPGTTANADWSAEANTPALLGYSLRAAGDVNGDGYADLLATAPGYSPLSGGQPLAGAGAWFVWPGSADGLGANGTPATACLAGFGDQAGAYLGRDDAGWGDVNNDGAADLFVAAMGYDHPEQDEGLVLGYYGGYRAYLPGVLR